MKHALIAFLFSSTLACAAPENYAPVVPAARPLPLRAITSTNDWWRHATNTNDFEATSEYIIPDGQSIVRLGLSCFGRKWRLSISRGAVTYEPVQYANYHGPGGGAIVQAFTGDLNTDGDADFIMVQCNGGACGLAAHRTDNLLLLSDGSGGFRLWDFETYGISTNDFVFLSGNSPCSVIVSRHLQAKAHDGKTHSYWVFAPYQVVGDALSPLNNDVWPMWTWHTIKPNHKPTSHLTRDKKDSLWNKYRKEYEGVQERQIRVKPKNNK